VGARDPEGPLVRATLERLHLPPCPSQIGEQLAADPRTGAPLRPAHQHRDLGRGGGHVARQPGGLDHGQAGRRERRETVVAHRLVPGLLEDGVGPSVAPAGQQAAERGQGQSSQLVRLVDLVDQVLQPGLGVVPRSVTHEHQGPVGFQVAEVAGQVMVGRELRTGVDPQPQLVEASQLVGRLGQVRVGTCGVLVVRQAERLVQARRRSPNPVLTSPRSTRTQPM
jgi:hypothetical protein